MSGKVNSVKEQFREGLWDIKYKGNYVAFANAVWGGWKLIKQIQNNNNETITTIQLEGNLKMNDFIKGIVEHIEIIGITKNIPSMNEIFIKTVQNE